MFRTMLTLICVSVGVASFSSPSLSEELSLGLGDTFYAHSGIAYFDNMRITACHVTEQAFTITRRDRTRGSRSFASNVRINVGDSFILFNKDGNPDIVVKFISFNNNCTGKFQK